METVGFSPKLLGAVLAVIVGVVVYLTGEHELGIGLFTAGLASLGIGIAAPPGIVVDANEIPVTPEELE